MEKDLVKAFQQRLADLGWYSGPIDGVPGTRTEKAVVAFKTAAKLNPRPYVGVVTLHALFDDAAPKAPREPAFLPSPPGVPWMGKAKLKIGIRETPGLASNPEVMAWAKYLDLSASYTNDGIAWCGLFVGYIMKSNVPGDALPKNPLGARAWLDYGVPVEPAYGAILVFWRGSKSGWQGHVGFYVGEDNDNYYVLGGNQSDSVNISKIAKSRLLGARAPKSVAFHGRKVSMSTTGKVSTNEA